MSGPGQKNEFARKAKRMKYPLQTDNKDYGKKVKAVARRVDVVNSETGDLYGSRAIMTKEATDNMLKNPYRKNTIKWEQWNKQRQEYLKGVAADPHGKLNSGDIVTGPSGESKVLTKEEKTTFVGYLMAEADTDITLLPEQVISELKGLIRKGAKDLTQQWANALELTHKAYHVCNVRRPTPDKKGAWKQYEALIAYAVRQLSDTRGINGKWRTADVLVREATTGFDDQPIGTHRFWVRLPGHAAVEASAKTMDDVIEQIFNKLRGKGVKARVEHRTKEGAKLSILVRDADLDKWIKRDEVTIQDIS